MLERLEEELEKAAASGATADALLPKLVSLLGCGNDEIKEILSTLGWRIVEVADAGAGVRTVGASRATAARASATPRGRKIEAVRTRPSRKPGRADPEMAAAFRK